MTGSWMSCRCSWPGTVASPRCQRLRPSPEARLHLAGGPLRRRLAEQHLRATAMTAMTATDATAAAGGAQARAGRNCFLISALVSCSPLALRRLAALLLLSASSEDSDAGAAGRFTQAGLFTPLRSEIRVRSPADSSGGGTRHHRLTRGSTGCHTGRAALPLLRAGGRRCLTELRLEEVLPRPAPRTGSTPPGW